MTKDEALKLAFEALESIEWHGAGSCWVLDDIKALRAHNALKEALAQPEPTACITCAAIHAALDADESRIIRNAKDGYPEGRTARELTLLERVTALCTYAADWKRWCAEAETALALQRELIRAGAAHKMGNKP